MTVKASWRALIDDVLAELERLSELDAATVLLVGSVARHADTAASDIDVLVISPKQLKRVQTSPKAQVFMITRSRFLERLRGGDDFPHWVVRFGEVLSDKSRWWERLMRDPAIDTWPDWERKLNQAGARLSFASRLYASGDYDHAAEEFLLSARHLARAVLLKDRIFPLSQPELPKQLREQGCAELADLVDALADGSSDRAVLSRAERLLAEWLNRLSKAEKGSRRRKRAAVT